MRPGGIAREELQDIALRPMSDWLPGQTPADSLAACAVAAGLRAVARDDAELLLHVEIEKLEFHRETDSDRLRLRAEARVTPLGDPGVPSRGGDPVEVSYDSEYAAFDFWQLDDGSRVERELDAAYAALAPDALELLGRPAPAGCRQRVQ